MPPPTHPCLRCGACCAHFRIAFHWSETDACAGGLTPSALTQSLDPHRVVMRGTYGGQPIRCEQLRGDIAVEAHCGICALRPSPCYSLKPAWEDGTASEQCDKARMAHGMAPLTRDSWRPLQAERVDASPIATEGRLHDETHDQEHA